MSKTKRALIPNPLSMLAMVRSMGLEPIRSPIRPSNVRVCLFRHDRNSIAKAIILRIDLKVKTYFKRIKYMLRKRSAALKVTVHFMLRYEAFFAFIK